MTKDERKLELGRALREMRDKAGVSQRQVAQVLDTDPSTIGDYEHGRSEMGALRLLDFMRACGRDPLDLRVSLNGQDPDSPGLIVTESPEPEQALEFKRAS